MPKMDLRRWVSLFRNRDRDKSIDAPPPYNNECLGCSVVVGIPGPNASAIFKVVDKGIADYLKPELRKRKISKTTSSDLTISSAVREGCIAGAALIFRQSDGDLQGSPFDIVTQEISKTYSIVVNAFFSAVAAATVEDGRLSAAWHIWQTMDRVFYNCVADTKNLVQAKSSSKLVCAFISAAYNVMFHRKIHPRLPERT